MLGAHEISTVMALKNAHLVLCYSCYTSKIYHWQTNYLSFSGWKKSKHTVTQHRFLDENKLSLNYSKMVYFLFNINNCINWLVYNLVCTTVHCAVRK